jgi:hypothetical protein
VTGVNLLMSQGPRRPSRFVRTVFARLTVAVVLASLLAPAAAGAQDEKPPVPRFAFDLHGSTLKFKNSADVATPLGLSVSNMPGRGLGFQVGAHVYPLRLGWLTLGLGASLHMSGAHSGPTTDDKGQQVGHDVNVRLTTLSPQVSFNFGSGKGWSYLSGGIYGSNVEYSIDGVPVDQVVPRRKTINYGGGARWFMKDHLAFSLDVRFYAINPVVGTAETKESPRMTLLVLSAGISFK